MSRRDAGPPRIWVVSGGAPAHLEAGDCRGNRDLLLGTEEGVDGHGGALQDSWGAGQGQVPQGKERVY